ncbi:MULTISPECIES: hypothetical protein [unclassified Streptomyces]|uniref:hypothetical protein n=1 Tax=unclassified Streptomyces TaxID=2593676 RepID=UPI00083DBE0C|nr:hypothetical protein [Streptomyces sp. AVP053U2]ODA74724.1 hypothetical protein APS67_000913 [Streptomyces sp. AVP053U2]
MTGALGAGLRRVVEAADPVSGRVKGTETQLAGLVKRGLAFRHPRAPHDHFLTPAGHRIREGEAVPAPVEAAPVKAEAPATTGVFAARVGGEGAAHQPGPARRREVHSAWQGMLELRRMTNPDGATDRPCGWERSHLVQAAALALEAAGRPPAGQDPEGGYRVRETPQPEAVAVYEGDGEALRACAAALEGAGWQVGAYTEPRTRTRYLLASPRRV